MDQIPQDHQLQILNSVADTTTILQNLSPEETAVLVKLFRIQATAPFEVVKIKNTLVQVLILERQNYGEYLGLSKFSTLPEALRGKLMRFFEEVWGSFNQQINKRNNPSIQSNPPPFTPFLISNPSNIKDPNLDCFNYYRPYPYQVNYDSKLQFQQFPYYFNFSNPFSTSYAPKSLNFPSFTQQHPNPNHPQSCNPQNQNQSSQIQPESQSSSQLQFKRQYQSVSNPIKLPRQQGLTVIHINFLHCACQGLRDQQDSQFFQCPSCHKFYHFSCLKISKREARNCPLCVLSTQHIFTQSNPRIIKSGWLQIKEKEKKKEKEKEKDDFVLNIKLNNEQMQIFHMFLNAQQLLLQDTRNGSIQFRLIRIADNRSDLQQQSVIRTSFPISMSQLRKIKSSQQMSLKMKNIKGNSLIFYAITFSKYRKQKEMEEVYLKFQQAKQFTSIWQNKQKKQGQYLIVSLIHPISNKLISLPVRGQHCDHLECEDLLFLHSTFNSKFQSNNRLLCSYCNKIYTPHSIFLRDTTIFNLLKHNQPQRSRLSLQNGQITWLQNQPQPMQQEPVIEQPSRQENPKNTKSKGGYFGLKEQGREGEQSSSSDSQS